MAKRSDIDFQWKRKISPQTSHAWGEYRHGYLEFEISSMPGVQREIERQAFIGKVRAEANLKAVRDNRAAVDNSDVLANPNKSSEIVVLKNGRRALDRHVALNDERGDKAASVIEFGHSGYQVIQKVAGRRQVRWAVPPQRGHFILHRAFKLGAVKQASRSVSRVSIRVTSQGKSSRRTRGKRKIKVR